MHFSDGLAPGTPTDPPGHWFPFFQFGATIGAFLLFIVYLLIALTGFKGQPGENRAGLAFAGLLAGRDRARGALRRRPQGAVDLLVRQGLVARA